MEALPNIGQKSEAVIQQFVCEIGIAIAELEGWLCEKVLPP